MMWRAVCVTGMLLGMLTDAAAALDSEENAAVRVRRQTSSTCEDKYAALSPTHDRCLVDHKNATEEVLSTSTKASITNLHNSYRRDVDPLASNMQLMIWDDVLAATATKAAMQCSGAHIGNHDEPDYPGLLVGQSLRTRLSSWTTMIKKMYEEKVKKNYVHGGDYKSSVARYFQMVYYDANRVGCGMAWCPHKSFKKIRVCNYAVRMNTTIPPYNNGTSCGDCNSTCDSSGKLCDCQGKLCYNQGHINVETCECQCLHPWSGTNCEHICNGKECLNNGTLDTDSCVCDCTGEYTGDNCESACNGKECLNSGTLDTNSCVCDCAGEYTGDNCEIACNGKECLNSGTLDTNSCVCDCAGEYTGDNCEIACNGKECLNNGTLDTDSCVCDCAGEYTGDNCENACNGKVCLNSGTLDTDSCVCDCAAGYTGDNCENGCSDNPCQNGGTQDDETCACTCPEEFEGDNCETKKTSNSTSLCEPKYLDLSSTHTRCLEDHPSATQVELSQETKNNIVNLHNDYRKIVDPEASDMTKMVWDDNLAITASKWVMQCSNDHDNMDDRKEPDFPSVKIGQNLGLGHDSWEVKFSNMFGEKARLNYNYGDEYKSGIGHYYQMVTARTTRIGCGQAYCPHTTYKRYRACNYAPALNSAMPPYQNGTSCADCLDHCDSSGKLCDCGNRICQHGGTLDVANCTCQCSGMWTGDSCETLNCSRNDPDNCEWHNATKCGNTGYVKDPKMCPHLCRVCQNCPGIVCQNGGTLNYATCTCECYGDYVGDHCETLGCHTKDPEVCTTILPREDCVESSETQAPTFSICPIFCRSCTTNCTECENYGDLTTKPECSCKCKGSFTGDLCKICPSADPAYCIHIPQDWCTTPSSRIYFETNCPYKCGICPAP